MAFYTIPVPDKRTSFKRWVGSLSASLPHVTIPPCSRSDSEWRGWADNFMKSNDFLLPVPLKRLFPKDEDWRKWAILMIQNIQ